jgi:hypothetical protein
MFFCVQTGRTVVLCTVVAVLQKIFEVKNNMTCCQEGAWQRLRFLQQVGLQNMVFYWDYDDRIKPSTL